MAWIKMYKTCGLELKFSKQEESTNITVYSNKDFVCAFELKELKEIIADHEGKSALWIH